MRQLNFQVRYRAGRGKKPSAQQNTFSRSSSAISSYLPDLSAAATATSSRCQGILLDYSRNPYVSKPGHTISSTKLKWCQEDNRPANLIHTFRQQPGTSSRHLHFSISLTKSIKQPSVACVTEETSHISGLSSLFGNIPFFSVT